MIEEPKLEELEEDLENQFWNPILVMKNIQWLEKGKGKYIMLMLNNLGLEEEEEEIEVEEEGEVEEDGEEEVWEIQNPLHFLSLMKIQQLQ